MVEGSKNYKDVGKFLYAILYIIIENGTCQKKKWEQSLTCM